MASVMMIYPNNIFVEAPDHIELWSVWPDPSNPTSIRKRKRGYECRGRRNHLLYS
jgi:hypothetical protein